MVTGWDYNMGALVHRQGCFIPHFLQSFACSLRWSRSLIANVREKQSDTEYCILRCTAHRPFKWQRGSKSCLSMDVLISNLRSVVHGRPRRAGRGRKEARAHAYQQQASKAFTTRITSSP